MVQTKDDIKAAFAVEDLRVFRSNIGIPYAIVGHSPEYELISDTWLGGFDTDQEFRAVIEFIIERFETGGYRLWLADLRHLNSGFFHSDDWLANHVFPRVVAAGMQREAVVLPQYQGAPPEFDVFGSASSALEMITDGRVRGFDDIEQAKVWLLNG
ncbi:MAG: hypothetical protein RIC16_09175 [Rhodospirillales bacterium]